MPLQATSGAASYDAFGGGAPAAAPTYIEDVFSTWLYRGTGSAQTITNGIDFSTKGGMLWAKSRSDDASHYLFDTVRGRAFSIRSDSTGAQATSGSTEDLTSFNANGFSLGTSSQTYINGNGATFVSWSFREQPKFFDIVTYTGNGSTQNIAHNLGSVPGCIITKRTDSTNSWLVYHRSLGNDKYVVLNATSAQTNDVTIWNSTNPTSTQFSLGATTANSSGGTYIAYIFAHDAGGFGLTGTDNVISCGSFTTDGSGAATVTLGYEPQWLLVKASSTSEDWNIGDNMRGMPNGEPAQASGLKWLKANSSSAEGGQSTNNWYPTATGFKVTDIGYNSATFIYIAIRRGPMKVPTTGTSVFAPLARNTTGTATNITTTLSTVDLVMYGDRGANFGSTALVFDRLQGSSVYLVTSSTGANQNSGTNAMAGFDVQTGYRIGTDSSAYGTNYNAGTAYPIINWQFGRAPSFMDVVCYTGTGSATTFSHNLQAVPELMIVKRRDAIGAWDSYCSALANTEYVVLNTTAAKATDATRWNSTTPTSSVFSVGTSTTTNASAGTYVAYLFATCAGVSKVGSYTGTGTTQTIDCGFTAGARFVLIKRTDSTGAWYVWDTARGIVSGNDPYLLLNSTAAEVTNTDYIDTYSAGFEISSTAPAAINASAGTYIFLAIA